MLNIKQLSIISFICLLSQSVLSQNSLDTNPSESAFLKELVGQMHFIEGRLTSLAEAVPGDKYNWRPAEGVRSVGEVYTHAGGANYFLLSFIGCKVPEGLDYDIEKKINMKSDIIKLLKDSYEDARNFIMTLKEEDLDKEVELPFGKFTQRSLLFIVLNHGHEHLGQSVAYARMNGVTPPWSEEEN